ncbi:OLC1v1022657C1 [Oldenlandia corymbosa var. corymbosa]|uniref:OLC1v1022657C1 n=2 Tax=Magnoliopsida TaxID=3398 RepID=A0AAV1BYE0_OLDCO|nr:OLC1v1022657C1 [Oldenlandia corymbosa var. corymbosa]
MSWKNRGLESSSKGVLSQKLTILLCIGCFCAGMLFTDRMWEVPDANGTTRTPSAEDKKLKLVADCESKDNTETKSHNILGEVSKTHHAIQTLDKTISNLEMELAAARALQDSLLTGSPLSEDLRMPELAKKRKYLMVVGINTAFSSRKRRDSIRATWMPQGENRKKLEEEKGIIIRFVIGHSATSGGILDRAIEAEDKKHGDILRLEHVEGYLELSAKTKTYFTTAVALWDADFYVKVDDDVHVNIGTLGATLSRHRSKPRVYIGCMKSGPVLSQKGVRYHEPEHWKFGEDGNKYFRHATGQLYAISKDLATYISINQHVLHKYANEDVSLGSWFIGLDVEHIDDRRLCCGTPPGEIVSGRLRQATFVLHHLTGDAVEFAIQSTGSRRYIADAGRAKMLFGLLHFDEEPSMSSKLWKAFVPVVLQLKMGILEENVSGLKAIDCGLRLFLLPFSIAALWLTLTNNQENSSYGKVVSSHFTGFKYMVYISVVSTVYALLAAISLWVRCLVAQAWIFFVSDQVMAYLMVTSMAALGEILYLAKNGDQKVTWSEACSSYGKFCNRLKLIIGLQVVALCCFLLLAVISAYRLFSRFDPPIIQSKEATEEEQN